MKEKILRTTEIIVGTRGIGKFLGVSSSAVRGMFTGGAPIYRRGKRGDLVCEKAEIWEWHKKNLGAGN